MMAAGQASKNGAHVTLIDKMPALGRKLLLTGNGRCNFTNNRNIDEFYSCYGKNGKFLRNVFARFSNRDLMEFFKDMKIDIQIEYNSSVFPKSGRSSDIVNCLLDFMAKAGVKIVTECSMDKIVIKDKKVIGIIADHELMECDALIVATGGCSYPKSGSDGSGLKIAQEIGHRIITPRPGLVPMIGEGPVVRRLNGLSAQNVKAGLYFDDVCTAERRGDMLFTHSGFSGPAILDLSCNMPMDHKENIRLDIDLMPDLTEAALDRYLLELISEHGRMRIVNILASFLAARMSAYIVEKSCIPMNMVGAEIGREIRLGIIHSIKKNDFKIRGIKTFKESMITIGGIALDEIDPRTMASKLIKELYFCGEIIDVAGISGGYNLQAAFSTGYVAGETAAIPGCH